MYERGAMSEGVRSMAQRLGRLRDLKREVDLLSQRAAELELKAQGGVGRITGLPGGRRMDRVGEYGSELADLRTRIEKMRQGSMEELAFLYAFIDDIPDPTIRQIFIRRYIDGLSWLKVAQKTGRYDEQIPRKMHNAYLRVYLERNTDLEKKACAGRGGIELGEQGEIDGWEALV